MTADTIKLAAAYGLAYIIVIGGMAMLFLTRLDPPETDVQGLRLLIAGIMGGAVTFVFNRESATQATRAAESSMRASQPTTTVSAVGPGGTVTVEPPVKPTGDTA